MAAGKYPGMSSKKLVQILKKFGFEIVPKGRGGSRGKGSHLVLRHPDTPTRVTTVQSGSLDPLRVRRIADQIGLSLEDILRGKPDKGC